MKNSVKFSANTEFVNFKYAKGEIDIYQKMFHESFEIYLFLGGDVEFINNHTRRKLNPYELVIVPPGEYHQFAVRGELELYERCVIDIAPDFFEDGRALCLSKGMRRKAVRKRIEIYSSGNSR